MSEIPIGEVMADGVDEHRGYVKIDGGGSGGGLFKFFITSLWFFVFKGVKRFLCMRFSSYLSATGDFRAK